MNEPVPTPTPPSEMNPGKPLAAAAANAAGTGEPVPANQLTPEEQMALFEKELKENDWGHQPC